MGATDLRQEGDGYRLKEKGKRDPPISLNRGSAKRKLLDREIPPFFVRTVALAIYARVADDAEDLRHVSSGISASCTLSRALESASVLI